MPEFIMRWAQSKCGRFEIEADKSGTPVRLLEKKFYITGKAWVVVGEFVGYGEAMEAAEQIEAAKGRAA